MTYLDDPKVYAEGEYDLRIEVGEPGYSGHYPIGTHHLSAEEATRLGAINAPVTRNEGARTAQGFDTSKVSTSWEPIITPHKRGPGRPPKPRDDGLLHDA